MCQEGYGYDQFLAPKLKKSSEGNPPNDTNVALASDDYDDEITEIVEKIGNLTVNQCQKLISMIKSRFT